MYDAYQNLLNGLDIMLQVCHGIPQQRDPSLFPAEACSEDPNRNSAVTENCITTAPQRTVHTENIH